MDGFPAIVTGDSVLAKVRARLPEFTGALQRVAELDPHRSGRRRPVDHRRAGRAQRHLTRHGDPVLPGAGLRRLRRAAAGHRRRDRPGAAPAAGRWTSAARSSRPTRSSGCSARSWPPTPGPCTTPPRCWTCAEVERAADAIAAAPPGRHLRRQRQRPGRRGDAVLPAPHRRRRLGLGRRAQRPGQRRAAAARRRRRSASPTAARPARPSRCSPRPAATARPRSR